MNRRLVPFLCLFCCFGLSSFGQSVDFCNLQSPASATINPGEPLVATARVYEPSVTDFIGQGPGINAWIGVHDSNTPPDSWPESAWMSASYIGDVGSLNEDDEYNAEIGSVQFPGTYYYASRFQLNGGPYSYGGYNSNGFTDASWDGINNVSGVLTVTLNDSCNYHMPLTFDGNDKSQVSLNTADYGPSGTISSCRILTPIDAWYSFTMPFDGNLFIDPSTSINSEFVVFDACEGTLIGCAQKGQLILNLQQSNTYYMQVYKFNAPPGPLDFTIEAVPLLPNNSCPSSSAMPAWNAENKSSASFNTNGATFSGASAGCGLNARDGWYSFSMPFNGNVYVDNNSSINSKYVLYQECGGTPVACIDRGDHFFDLQLGTTYWMQVFYTGSTIGNLNFTLKAAPAIQNDECHNAIPVPDWNVFFKTSISFDTDGATVSGNTPDCGENSRDAWYTITMPFDGNLLVTDESDPNMQCTVYDACNGTELGCANRGDFINGLQGLTTYHVHFWHTNNIDGNLSVELKAAATVDNDECDNASVLTFDMNHEASAAFDTDGATNSTPAPDCATSARDGWYSFTMPFDGNIIIEAQDEDSQYNLYDACNGTEFGCEGPDSYFFSLSGGTTYWLRAYLTEGNIGVLSFTIKAFEQIPNDICSDAIELTFDGNNQTGASFLSNGASTSLDAPACTPFPNRDGWYRFTAPFSGSVLIEGIGNRFVLYRAQTGTDACLGTELDCGLSSLTVNDIQDGETYFLQTWRNANQSGELSFTISAIVTEISLGTINNCLSRTLSISNMNNNTNEWVAFNDNTGKVIAALHANGQELGITSVRVYVDGEDTRTFMGQAYARRSVQITSAETPAQPVGVKIYMREDEFLDLAAATPLVTTADDLILIKQELENCAAPANGSGAPLLSQITTYNLADISFTTQVDDFSVFYITAPSNVFPVELVAFSGEAKTKTNQLSWTTASEVNTDYFELQRAVDARNWVPVGQKAAQGFSDDLTSYTLFDEQPLPQAYYRLKMVDLDGSLEYSSLVFIDRSDRATALKVYPNPCQDRFHLSHVSGPVSVFNTQGQLVKYVTTGTEVSMQGLPKGVYLIRTGEQYFKMIKSE